MNDDEKRLDQVTEEQEEAVAEVLEESGSAAEPIPEQPAAEKPEGGEVVAKEEKPGKAGKKPIVFAAVAAVIVAVVAFVASMVASSPLLLVGKGIENSVAALKRNDVVSLVTAVVNGGSVEALCDLETLAGYSLDGTASVKLYLDGEKKAAATANLEMDGDSVLDAKAFADWENIAVSSEALFGDEAYGISLKHLVENFEDSVFGPDGDLSLGIEIPEVDESLLKESAQLTEDARKITKDVIKTLVKSIGEHAEISKEKETLDFNGEKVKVTAVSIEVNGEAMVAIAEDMLEYLRENEELKEYLYRCAEYSETLIPEDEMYGYYAGMESVLDDFYDSLEEIEDGDLEDLGEMMEEADAEGSVVFYITKSGKELVGVKFDGEADGEKVKISVTAGPTWENLEEISFRYDDGYTAARASYLVEVNDKNEYSAELKLREDGETVVTGEFTWDKKNGDFELELTDDWGDSYGVEGSIEVTSKATTITLDSAYEYDYEVDLGVSVILTSSDKMPAMPGYTDVLEMSMDDIEDLAYDIEDILYELSYMFY